MEKKVAILRGINVGGKRKILMKDLKLLFEKMRYTNVTTYKQSGNVIFNTTDNLSDIEISMEVQKAISDKYGFDVPVIIRSIKDLEQTIARNPFLKSCESDINQLYLTFLNETPSPENIKNAELSNTRVDRFVVDNRNVFVFCEGKYHQSKLTNNFFENKLKVTATTRNWKTILKLIEFAT